MHCMYTNARQMPNQPFRSVLLRAQNKWHFEKVVIMQLISWLDRLLSFTKTLSISPPLSFPLSKCVYRSIFGFQFSFVDEICVFYCMERFWTFSANNTLSIRNRTFLPTKLMQENYTRKSNTRKHLMMWTVLSYCMWRQKFGVIKIKCLRVLRSILFRC